jgi:uncharacterized membrane protein YbhN (UPF0104 family)
VSGLAAPGTFEPRTKTRLLRAVVVFAAAGTAIYLAAALWAGADRTVTALARLGVGAMLIGTAVASLAYVARFGRWHVILLALGHRLPVGLNLRAYIAGLAMTSSPGKLGETLRSILLLPHGVTVPQSLAAFFADRLSDVVGVALLGAAAGWLTGGRQPLLEVLLIGALGGPLLIALFLGGQKSQRWPGTTPGRGRMARVLAALAAPAKEWARIWTVPRLLVFTAAAVAAYGLQALVFAAYAMAIGAQVGIGECIAIFASATLLGAASMIPAGLGAMEAALVVQLAGKGVDTGDAVALAIATRLSTLWCSIFLGLLALATFIRPRQQRPAPAAID